MRYNLKCQFCGKTVKYWPNYSPNTSKDYGDVEMVQRGRKETEFFHRSCYLKNCERMREQHEYKTKRD